MTVAGETVERSVAPFFVTGGTLQSDAASYVVRHSDDKLFASLLAGEYCYVLNSRQMGKSSLMVRTAQRLKAEGVTVADIDLTAIGQNLTPEQWYDGLLTRLGRKLDCEDELEAFYADNLRIGPFQRWQLALATIVLPKIQDRLVIFVDEIDVVRSLPFSADEFFAGIRQCYVGRATDPDLSRLCFCLLGTATPADLIQDTKTGPFNIGKRIEVRDFASDEALPLARGLGERGTALLARVLYWTGGHPYLTQRLCRSVAESGAKSSGEVDTLCSELFLTHKAKETDDNLLFVRNRLLKSEADLVGLLALFRDLRSGRPVADDDSKPLPGILKLSGVARVEDGQLQIRNRIYSHVFDQAWAESQLPGDELKRQKAAYRQGLMKVALPGAWIILLPQLAVLLSSDHTERSSFVAAFLAYSFVVGTIGFVTFGILFRPGNVRPGLLAGIIGCTLLGTIIVLPIGSGVSPLNVWTGDASVWVRHFLLISFMILLNWMAIVLPIYFFALRDRRDYSPLAVGYMGAASGVSVGYFISVAIGLTYVLQGKLSTGTLPVIATNSNVWPLNPQNLIIFLVAFFLATPLTIGLLSGIVGYTIGLARSSERKSAGIVIRGLLIYLVLMLAINGIYNNMVRTTVVAATLLACAHYVSRRTE